MATNRDELIAERLRLDKTGSRVWLIAGVVGLIGLGAAAVLATTTEHGRQDFFHSYLANFMYFLSLALGGLVFVLISHLTRAGWSVALRRIAEVLGWTVLPLSVLSLVILFGMHDLYEWTHTDVVAGDELLQHKQAWLNPTFFIVRVVFYFAVWIAMALFFLRKSEAQDTSGDSELTLQMEKIAAPSAIVYSLTVTFAAFDLIMSLYPHWYSTIFGVYYFSGCILGFFALTPVVIALIKRRGYLTRLITTEHAHDLGKLMFGFVVFWAYIAFSQYMLIWYGNLPEETVWYEARENGIWAYISLTLLFGHFYALGRHLLPRDGRGAARGDTVSLDGSGLFLRNRRPVPGCRLLAVEPVEPDSGQGPAAERVAEFRECLTNEHNTWPRWTTAIPDRRRRFSSESSAWY
jgi:hypothetical protein